MRLIKTFGLAAVAAMAFVGATSASATSTQLCNSHTALTCGSAATSVSMNNAGLGSGFLLNDLVNFLCLTISGSATPLSLADPQSVHFTALSFTNCGTKASHANCEVVVNELPLANLNKTGLDSGTLTATNGKIVVICDEPSIFIMDIECTYDITGLSFAVGTQHLTANETPIDEIGSDILCPATATLDGLLKTTANRYVLA